MDATALVQPGWCLITELSLHCGVLLLFYSTRRKYIPEPRRMLTDITALFTHLIQWVGDKMGAPNMNVEEEDVDLWGLVTSHFGYQRTPCCKDHLLLWILQQNSLFLIILYFVQRLFNVKWVERMVICSDVDRIHWLWHILRNLAAATEFLCKDILCFTVEGGTSEVLNSCVTVWDNCSVRFLNSSLMSCWNCVAKEPLVA
jgi:hypothetical protein